MKFLGQYIQQFKARFRDEVYLENIVNPGSDTDKFLVVDSDGKVGFRTGTNLQSDLLVTPGSHVVDLVTITSDSGAGARSAQTGQPAFTFLGGTDIDVTNSSGTFTVAFTNDSGYTTNTGDIDRVQISTSSVSPASVTSGDADFSITGSSPIGVSNSGTNITVAASDASTSAKGVASFSSDNFSVSSGVVTIKSGGVDLSDEVTGVLTQSNLPDDMDSDKVKQIVITTHNFQMANTTGTFFYIPFNNLNESSAGGTSNYWTRTVPPYPGTIKKIAVRSHTSLGTSCELRISKITDTTDALTGGTHVDNTSIDISSANVSVIETMNTNSFAAGDAVGIALKRSAGSAARVVMTVVWEYTL